MGLQGKGKVSVAVKKRQRDDEVVDKSGSDSEGGVSSSGVESGEDDDELDLDGVSSSDGEGEAEGEAEGDDEEDEDENEAASDDDFPRKKKSKISKHDDGSSGFSSAVNAILSSHLKAYDRKDPIMARNKKVLKQNESDKLEQKAKKQIANEKKKILAKARKTDIIPIATEGQSGEEVRKILEKEARLRKIAQKGAVKLFNAILSTQVKTDHEIKTSLTDIKNKQERKEYITEVSKEKFLDLVKAAGDDDDM
ncbi:hypothetical protein Kpol_505p40 [Vanderwaltozyma polyspora DSM 70294]|uniref:Ribosomal RNA-processing protein 15 n=1 Tax=Vanderwaltozyma polyspora (strain ATCC 22028 / DSM 70294 / BCRC 21397 / CBS 2163 / NBRC 10782 / NRRL Y-8283 / UCD 57-17) TaxID=436907 RepID=A7TND1_VANPO|nr:uncharacterized protein Kpol_505p40 [Vanderwaltozyma polyspora DSM 70294]EDO16263.1 hypothetical protein Kpol_505p40 [Vanderwaltozyma polyspora DSM 70294]